jgi:membrane-bound lytic murein transglycosylase B
MKKNKSHFILQALTLWIVLGLSACSAYADKPEVHLFIEKMVKQYNFDRQQLQALFNSVKSSRSILASFSRPTENLTWSDYKPIFVTEKRARQGAKFWSEHSKTLNIAQQRYGVPPSIIVAILGVETRYGEVTGKYRVLDSLSALSFSHSRRASFFQNELVEFLLLSRENPSINPIKTKGSYAGAIGQVQFLPSNYRHLAVDASRKGYSDLVSDSDDAILSVAHYLKFHGWVTAEPIAVGARMEDQGIHQLPTSFKDFTVKKFEKYAIYPQDRLPSELKTTLIALPINQGKEYWLGFTNFQVIKRYNSSSLYAMAVCQLSELINHYHQQEHCPYDNKK